jgi:hypothetical protein
LFCGKQFPQYNLGFDHDKILTPKVACKLSNWIACQPYNCPIFQFSNCQNLFVKTSVIKLLYNTTWGYYLSNDCFFFYRDRLKADEWSRLKAIRRLSLSVKKRFRLQKTTKNVFLSHLDKLIKMLLSHGPSAFKRSCWNSLFFQ